MIANDEELSGTLEQLERLYRSLHSLRTEVTPNNQRNFAVLAQGTVDFIRRLQEEIEAYTGFTAAVEHDADVWLRLRGRDLQWPNAPTSVLTAFLDSFRKGLQLVAEFMVTGQVTTRPTDELKRACDLRIVGLEAGSPRVGIRLPEEAQLRFDYVDDRLVAERALGEYLEVAEWVDSQAPDTVLEGKVADPSKRRLLLNALKPLVPRPRGDVESLEISGRLVPRDRPIRLTRAAHDRIDRAIDSAVAEQVETHIGDLREIDLDRRSFILRNTDHGGQIQCTFYPELWESTKEALDRRVEVSGSRAVRESSRSASALRVSRLEVVDGGEPAGAEVAA